MAAAAPSLTAPTRLSPANPLTVWHLLSLDAPTVATLWTWFVTRATHAPRAPHLLPATFLAVWILYALDRLLDTRILDTRPPSPNQPTPRHPERSAARSHRATRSRRTPTRPEPDPTPFELTNSNPYPPTQPHLQPRHLFHHRYRRAFATAIVFATAVLLPFIATFPRALLTLYITLAATLALWYAAIHSSHRPLPKELAVGLFFAAAVFLPSARDSLLLPAMLFANLCTLNCLHIHAWEHPAPSPAAHSTTRLGLCILRPLTLTATLLPLALIPFLPASTRLILVALTLAATLLFILDLIHQRFQPTNLRAAADLVLLTPLLMVPFLR